MKKILYLILTLVLIVTVSSYTMPSIDKKVPVTDTININVNVHQNKSLQNQTSLAYEDLRKSLDSRVNLDNAKARLLNKISEEYKQESYTTLDRLCNDYGYSITNVLKMSRRDVNLRFIGSLLTFLSTLVIIIYFIQKSIRDKLDWKLVLIFSIVVILGLYIINTHLQSILSYIFNHDYLTIKELIKFF